MITVAKPVQKRIAIRMKPHNRYKRLQIKPRIPLDRGTLPGCPPPPPPWLDITRQLDQQQATEVWQHIVTSIVTENLAYNGRAGEEALQRQGLERPHCWVCRKVRTRHVEPDASQEGPCFVWT